MLRNNQTAKVGITGGIGAGKSIVSKVFKLLGIPVYDADERAKYLMNHHEELRDEIIREFGEQAYKDGGLNRSYLATHVFNDEKKLKILNGLVHPRVGEDYRNWLNEHRLSPYTLKEAALLFEAGTYKQLDKVIFVSAPEKIRIERVLLRDPHRTADDIKKIIHTQWPEEKKKELADFVINNDNDHLVIPQILKFHNKMITAKG